MTGSLIVAEDHWAQGGLGDAVLEALADADNHARVRRLAVHTMPTSGRPNELLWRSGIDRTVRRFGVTSSPVAPSPRVAPCTKMPLS